jgi:hypothetical protein
MKKALVTRDRVAAYGVLQEKAARIASLALDQLEEKLISGEIKAGALSQIALKAVDKIRVLEDLKARMPGGISPDEIAGKAMALRAAAEEFLRREAASEAELVSIDETPLQ